MATYRQIVTAGDFGPWVSKLVLDLPGDASEEDVHAEGFNVFCERHVRATGEVLMRKEAWQPQARPSRGYVTPKAAYPANAAGNRVARGGHIALELTEERLNKTIEGGVMGSKCLSLEYRVTQLAPLPGDDAPMAGLVFDECAAVECPALAGWSTESGTFDGIQMDYGVFEPDFAKLEAPRNMFGNVLPGILEPGQTAPLVLWLHGAGEGVGAAPGEPERAWLGNRVTEISGSFIQKRLGGAAYVLCPQSPTFWMDNGVEQLGRSNQSIYSRAVSELVRSFVAAHPRVDAGRIIVGGLSNGGFMTCRLIADNPGLFSCGIACCAPWYVVNEKPEELAAMAKTPIWFVHSKGDELVTLEETALPLYHELVKAGDEAHFTLYDHVEDLTGAYKAADGTNLRTFNHGVWIHVYHDFPTQDLDGRAVLVDGRPVSVWEWAGLQRRQ